MKEAADVKRATETRAAVQQQLAELDARIAAETDAIAAAYAAEPVFERVTLAPRRGRVAIEFVALGWVPVGTP